MWVGVADDGGDGEGNRQKTDPHKKRESQRKTLEGLQACAWSSLPQAHEGLDRPLAVQAREVV